MTRQTFLNVKIFKLAKNNVRSISKLENKHHQNLSDMIPWCHIKQTFFEKNPRNDLRIQKQFSIFPFPLVLLIDYPLDVKPINKTSGIFWEIELNLFFDAKLRRMLLGLLGRSIRK